MRISCFCSLGFVDIVKDETDSRQNAQGLVPWKELMCKGKCPYQSEFIYVGLVAPVPASDLAQ